MFVSFWEEFTKVESKSVRRTWNRMSKSLNSPEDANEVKILTEYASEFRRDTDGAERPLWPKEVRDIQVQQTFEGCDALHPVEQIAVGVLLNLVETNPSLTKGSSEELVAAIGNFNAQMESE